MPECALPLLLVSKQIHDESYDVLVKKFDFIHVEITGSYALRDRFTSRTRYRKPAECIAGHRSTLAAAIAGFRGYRARIDILGNATVKGGLNQLHIMLIDSIQHDVFLQQLAMMSNTLKRVESVRPRNMPISINFLHQLDLSIAVRERIEDRLLRKISSNWFGFRQIKVAVSKPRAKAFRKELRRCRWSCLEDLVQEQEAAQAQGKILCTNGQYAEAVHVLGSGLRLDDLIHASQSSFSDFLWEDSDDAVLKRYHRVQFYLNFDGAAASLRLAKDQTDLARMRLHAAYAAELAHGAIEHSDEDEAHMHDAISDYYHASDAEVGNAWFRMAQAHALLEHWSSAGANAIEARILLPENVEISKLEDVIQANGGFDPLIAKESRLHHHLATRGH